MELGLRSLPTASVLGNVTLCSYHLGMLPQRATAENLQNTHPITQMTESPSCLGHPLSHLSPTIKHGVQHHTDHTRPHWRHLITQHCISSLLHSGPKYHTSDRITTRRVSKMV